MANLAGRKLLYGPEASGAGVADDRSDVLVGAGQAVEGGGGGDGGKDAYETCKVTLELGRRGYTEDQIEKIWSGNLLRVLDEVQAVAAQIQAEGR